MKLQHHERSAFAVPACVAVALVALLCGAAGAQDSVPASGRWTLVHCGTLLAVPGAPARDRATVVIHDDRITEVRDGFVAPAEAGLPPGANVVVVDARSWFVLPGLIDCHTHLSLQFDRGSRLRAVEESDAHAALRGAAAARRTLAAGFTTVRDLGSTGACMFALRDCINLGLIAGPRILTAGQSITPTGGHSDETLGFRADLFAIPTTVDGVADGPLACRQAVRAQVKRGADVIKLTATGGVLSNTAQGLSQQFFDDELVAIVTTGHLLGRKVAAHAHGSDGIKAALRAGVDSIEHGTYLDDEAIALFRQTGAWLVPTLTAGDTVTRAAAVPGYYPRNVAEKATRIAPAIKAACARAWKGGVKIAFGTDAGVFEHGENGREFELMVEAGIPPEATLVAATVSAAELLGLSPEIGTIAGGKAADLIAVEGDPRQDIRSIRRVRWVMRAGKDPFAH